MENGTRIDVDMMYIRNKFRVGDRPDLKAKIIEIPYEGNNLVMLIFVPNKPDDLIELEYKLKGFNYSGYEDDLMMGSYKIGLPRFLSENQIDMRSSLEKIDLGVLFNPQASFSQMSPDIGYITKIIQTAVFEVDETGSELKNQFFEKASIEYHDKPIVLNYPFLFAIIYHHKGNKHLLFFGRVGGIFGKNLKKADDLLIKMKKYFSHASNHATFKYLILFNFIYLYSS